MSRFFAHTAYAEDQPLAHTILTTHVLTRAVSTGAVIGLGIAGARQAVAGMRGRRTGSGAPRGTATGTAAAAPPPPPPFAARLVQTTARSTLVTVALASVALVARMAGREPIEWQDRSWRLLENPGQLETDDWTYAGMGVGAAAAGLVRGGLGGWTGLVGAVGLGSVGGVLGYMTWRYGVHGGKFPALRAERVV